MTWRTGKSIMLAALENVSEDEDINRAWKSIKKISKPELQRV